MAKSKIHFHFAIMELIQQLSACTVTVFWALFVFIVSAKRTLPPPRSRMAIVELYQNNTNKLDGMFRTWDLGGGKAQK
jgi:hypothetical protein